MKKFLLPGILTVLVLLSPLKSQAAPLDVPYTQVLVGTATTSVQLSTTAFPVAPSTGTVSYEWCVDHVTVSVGNNVASTFEMFYATQSLTAASTAIVGTTNYVMWTSSSAPFDTQFGGYRTPYCAPPGTYLTLWDSIAGSIISFEAYIWKGWNP